MQINAYHPAIPTMQELVLIFNQYIPIHFEKDTTKYLKKIHSYYNTINWIEVSSNPNLTFGIMIEFRHRMKWNLVSKFAKLSDEAIVCFIDEINIIQVLQHQTFNKKTALCLLNKVDWKSVKYTINLPDNFILEFHKKINWKIIKRWQTLSIPILRRFHYKFNWREISKRSLPSDIICELAYNLHWDLVCQFSVLTYEIIDKFKNLVQWKVASEFQKFPVEVIEKFIAKIDIDKVNESKILDDEYKTMVTTHRRIAYEKAIIRKKILQDKLNNLKTLQWTDFI